MNDIIEFLPDPTLAIGRDRSVTIWNKAIEGLTGIPAAEMIGKGYCAYAIPFYGKAQPMLMDLVFENCEGIAARYPSVRREGDSLVGELFCKALNNDEGAWVSVKASPLHDQSGNIIGAIESIRDITKSRQSDDALRESEQKYGNYIGDL